MAASFIRQLRDESETGKIIEDYKLGEIIGKGAFGQVYRALNTQTGDFVAVKSLTIQKMTKEEMNSLMGEVELLKELSHEHIVKYLGFIKTKEHIYIILELCENGSLAQTVKKFGSLPESLVAIYTAQVLIGLAFLHQQGVIHRDIKGANILITAEGSVKLADFGVARRANEISSADAVGTPYWMAPEVIEMTGHVGTVSDVWSVGCTVIELLTGQPPYFNMGSMSALFHIVQDPHPPLPNDTTANLKDFLMQCFQKNPSERPTSIKLLAHPWIEAAVKARKATIAGSSSAKSTAWSEVVQRTLELHKSQPEPSRPSDSFYNASSTHAKIAEDDEESQTVVAINASPTKSTRTLNIEIQNNPADLSNTARLGRASVGFSPFQAAAAQGEEWGDDIDSMAFNEETHDHQIERGPVMFVNENSAGSSSRVHEYLKGDDSAMDASRPNESSLDHKHLSMFFIPENADSEAQNLVLMTDGAPNNFSSMRGETTINNNNASTVAAAAVWEEIVEAQLEDYVENDGDYDLGKDLVGVISGAAMAQAALERARDAETFIAFSDEVSSSNTAAVIAPVFTQRTEQRLNNQRELHNHLTAINPSANEMNVSMSCAFAIRILIEQPEHKISLVTNHMILDLLQCLAVQTPGSQAAILRLINQIMDGSATLCLALCIMGLLNLLPRFSSGENLADVRLQTACIIKQLTITAPETIQMFIACQGLTALSSLLDEDLSRHCETVCVAISCAWDIVRSPGLAMIKLDICSLLANVNFMERLSAVMSSICTLNTPPSPKVVEAFERGLNLYMTFSMSGSTVKSRMADGKVVKTLLLVLSQHNRAVFHLLRVLRTLRNLSAETNCRGPLVEMGIMNTLIPYLTGDFSHQTLQNDAMNILYNICKLDKQKQNAAAIAGVIPHLQKLVLADSPLKQLALPVLCDMVHASPACRAELWKNKGVSFYLQLLSVKYWQPFALDSVASWLTFGDKDRSRVETELVQGQSMNAIIGVITTASDEEIEKLLPPLQKMLTASKTLNRAMGYTNLATELMRHLRHPNAVVRLNLVMLLKLLYEQCENPTKFIHSFRLDHVLGGLVAEDSAVLVNRVSNMLLAAIRANCII